MVHKAGVGEKMNKSEMLSNETNNTKNILTCIV